VEHGASTAEFRQLRAEADVLCTPDAADVNIDTDKLKPGWQISHARAMLPGGALTHSVRNPDQQGLGAPIPSLR